MTNVVATRCANCMELQRSLMRALGDKRSLLTRLQKEQARTRKLLRDGEKYYRKLYDGRNPTFVRKEDEGQSSDVSSTSVEEQVCFKWQVNEVMEVNKKWKEEYLSLKEKHNAEKKLLTDELDETKYKLNVSETKVLALESEVTRLASTLNELHQRHGSATASEENFENLEVFKQQIQVYKEDFSNERRDRERAQSEKEELQQQLQDAHEMISTLLQEVDVYKEQLEQCQAEVRQQRRHSIPSSITSRPHLQIVYPINGATPSSHTRWKQEQQRRGVLARGPSNTQSSPQRCTNVQHSMFYGGDVEVDRD